MSSWLPSTVGRVSLLLFAPTLGCDQTPAPTAVPPAHIAVPPTPPAPLVVPWFQGQWLGSATSEDALHAAPITAHLTIDASGRALGSSSLSLDLRGVVDGAAVRLEASGPGGHGAVVLHQRAGGLDGVLRYAAAGADQGKSALLKLTRAEPP